MKITVKSNSTRAHTGFPRRDVCATRSLSAGAVALQLSPRHTGTRSPGPAAAGFLFQKLPPGRQVPRGPDHEAPYSHSAWGPSPAAGQADLAPGRGRGCGAPGPASRLRSRPDGRHSGVSCSARPVLFQGERPQETLRSASQAMGWPTRTVGPPVGQTPAAHTRLMRSSGARDRRGPQDSCRGQTPTDAPGGSQGTAESLEPGTPSGQHRTHSPDTLVPHVGKKPPPSHYPASGGRRPRLGAPGTPVRKRGDQV